MYNIIIIDSDVHAFVRQKLVMHRPHSAMYPTSIFNRAYTHVLLHSNASSSHFACIRLNVSILPCMLWVYMCTFLWLCPCTRTVCVFCANVRKMQFFILVQRRPMDEVENYTIWHTDKIRCFTRSDELGITKWKQAPNILPCLMHASDNHAHCTILYGP